MALDHLLLVLLAGMAASCISPSSSSGGANAPSAPTNAKSCGPEGVIDDGEDGNNQVSDAGGRGGYWYTFLDKVGSSITPKPEAQGGKFAMVPQGANGSQYGANAKGKVAAGEIVYAGVGFNFLDPKAPYDASKYDGISFWAKRGSGSTGKVRLKVPDTNTDPDGKVCSACFNDFGKDLSLTEEWTKFTVPFSEMRQLGGWGAPHPPHIESPKIYGVQWQVNQPGAAFDISIDDLQFICK
ncbi:MAG TPA: carbohydrate binding domain-containing protein [Polyangiaceae bacterium]|nr:carbohydrate binding domain-containing protein [Polyangiaceae bacterium]